MVTAVAAPSVGDVVTAPAIRALIAATVVVNAVYLGALLLPGDPASALVNVWLSLLAVWLPVGVFWLVAVRTAFAKWEVTLVAAAVTANAAGDTYFSLAMDSSGNLPSPSFADLGYLIFYPLMLAALVVLVRRQSRTPTVSVAVDSTLAVLGASAVLAVVLAPVFNEAADTTPIDAVIAALYPLFDLLLVATVVGISASPLLRLGPRWQLLLTGLVLFTGADIAYALLNHEGAYVSGTPLDVAWTAGVAFIALWVDGVDRVRPVLPSASSRGRLLPVPALAVLAGVVVLLVATQTRVPTVAFVLAAAAVALSAVPVMFRQSMLARVLEGQEQVVARLTALDKSKSDMIGTVSHEMRTPLTSILGFLELVLDDAGGTLPKSARDMLLVVDRNAQRLHTLVGNMLVLTRLESGDATLATAPVELTRVLGRSAESLRPFAQSREVQFTIDCGDAAIVEGDEAHLERVFTNVMENAVKFTPAGGSVHVGVASGIALAGRPAVRVSVADTGMGIPTGDIPQLFDRFFRATNARDEVVPGTGLGLAIVNDIVRSHGGEISVTSVVGEGSTFGITLPVRR
ncbi:sensor histidine kinase [Conyzicola sp.]|uniref:sensor histidine kinase n=1 Tax=Conyzicola sp. TaxID=1969404 RepID=UPI00398A4A9E